MAPAELKFEDSNLAGIASDLDAGIRKAAAESEEEFQGAGTEAGIEIWRIEKFEPKKIDANEIGTFYSGDAYVVLQTYTVPDTETLAWNLHFFLGKDSTQDERGTAAYLTVNLDDLLGGKPVQYRECEGNESLLFLSHFPFVKYLDGGVASGFKQVEPETYTPRLLHIFGPSHAVRVKQVPLLASSLNKSDVFILDAGLKLYHWNPENASPFEKMRASTIREKIQAERDGEPEELIIEGDEISEIPQIWEILGEMGEIPEAGEEAKDVGNSEDENPRRTIYVASDESGEMELSQVAEGETLDRSSLSTDDVSVVVSVVGSKTNVYFYAGKNASVTEKFYLAYSADKILESIELPPFTAVSTISESTTPSGDEAGFDSCFAA